MSVIAVWGLRMSVADIPLVLSTTYTGAPVTTRKLWKVTTNVFQSTLTSWFVYLFLIAIQLWHFGVSFFQFYYSKLWGSVKSPICSLVYVYVYLLSTFDLHCMLCSLHRFIFPVPAGFHWGWKVKLNMQLAVRTNNNNKPHCEQSAKGEVNTLLVQEGALHWKHRTL